MRGRWLFALAAAGAVMIAIACGHTVDIDAQPVADAGVEAASAPVPDATIGPSPEAGPPNGDFISVFTGDPGLYQFDLQLGFDVGASGNILLVLPSKTTVSLGDSGLLPPIGRATFAPDGGLLSIGPTKASSITRAAFDSAEDEYLAASQAVPDGGLVQTAYYARHRVDAGEPVWDAPLADDWDGDNSSNVLTLATRGTDLAVGVYYNGAIAFLTTDGNTPTRLVQTGNSGAFDSTLLFVNTTFGRVAWHKVLSGGGIQAITAIAINDQRDVTVAAEADQRDVRIDGTPVGEAGPAAISVLVARFSGATPHDALFQRLIPIPQGTIIPEAVKNLSNGDVVLCGKLQNVTKFDDFPLTLSDDLDGFVARVNASTDGKTAWIYTWGGTDPDDCGGLAVDAHDRIALGLNHKSSGVKFQGIALKDPPNGSVPASAIAKLNPDGSLAWLHDHVGATRIVQLVTNSAEETLYAGWYQGDIDLTGGTAQGNPLAGRVNFFVARRAP
jgi:hypothetical protein